jgi:transcriptional regulator with XRE-family HTH domain
MDKVKMNEPNIGEVIRSFRIQQELSLRELSQRSDLSINAISKIENGMSSPTVSSLHKLARALRVQITDFFTYDIQPYSVFVKATESTMLQSNGITIKGLGKGLPNQRLEPYIMIVSPESDQPSEDVSHTGEEFIYCLSGRIKYFVGEKEYILEKGDKLLFKANQPHSWCNIGVLSAEVIMVLETDQNEPYPHKLQ